MCSQHDFFLQEKRQIISYSKTGSLEKQDEPIVDGFTSWEVAVTETRILVGVVPWAKD